MASLPVTQAWNLIDRLQTEAGIVELRQRGPGDFHLCLGGRILMNSRSSRSEEALGHWVAEAVSAEPRPRLLIAGLGMGLTLRAALDTLPEDASVLVAEIEPRVIAWCRGPLRDLCRNALEDPRVCLEAGDVSEIIRRADARFDGIALDLYEGVRILPGAPSADPCYGEAALARAHTALRGRGVFARWCEQPDPHFERRLARTGFTLEQRRAGRGGRRHSLYCARRS
jgi:spermidine synthase